MRRTLLGAICLLFLAGTIQYSEVSIAANRIVYSNKDLHYKLKLPEGWEEIPKSAIDEASASVKASSNIISAKLIKFDAAFQKKANAYFTFPYLLISNRIDDTQTLGELKNSLLEELSATKQKQGTLASIAEEMKMKFNNWNLNVDETRKRIIVTFDADSAVGGLRASIVSIPGKYGTVMLNIYSYKEPDYSDVKDINYIMDNFAFDRDAEYSTFWKYISKLTTPKAIKAATTGAFLALLWPIISKLRKKNIT
ncbi:MAG: hypothetical protein WC956_00460 [bacterium]